MILNIQTLRSSQCQQYGQNKDKKWQHKFRHSLVHRNNAFIINNNVRTQNKRIKLLDQSKEQLLKLHLDSSSKNNIPTITITKTPHGIYSQFIPLQTSNYWGLNQLTKCVPYLAHLEDNQQLETRDYLIEDIIIKQLKGQNNQKYTKRNNNIKLNQRWQKILQKFNPKLTLTQKLHRYIELLKFGKQPIINFHQQSYIFTLKKLENYFSSPVSIKQNISVTIENKQAITLENISKTMKSLFCPICLIYDCGCHQLNGGEQFDTNYVSEGVKIMQERNYREVLGIFLMSQRINKNQKTNKTNINNSEEQRNMQNEQYEDSHDADDDQKNCHQQEEFEYCSQQCYLKLLNFPKVKLIPQEAVLQRRATTLSSLSKSLIQLGVHIFSYNPCYINKLFNNHNNNSQITCKLVYIYFMKQKQLCSYLQHKMYRNQVEMLKNEGSEQIRVLLQRDKNINGIKNKKNKNMKYNHQHLLQNSNISICMHHFINKQSVDQFCKNCICRKRGYCLPSCLCGKNCPIMKIGCKCKNNNTSKIKPTIISPVQCCKTNRCPCHKNKISCIPELCGCLSHQDIYQNCSNYVSIFSNQDKTSRIKIGNSMIPGAGLGAFSTDKIQKDSLVAIYLGQKIQPYIQQLRELFKQDNTFYNFETTGRSIDARYFGNKARFINHGTQRQENLRVNKILNNGQQWVVFHALRDIQQCEQLLFDYDGTGDLAIHHKDKYPFIKPKRK